MRNFLGTAAVVVAGLLSSVVAQDDPQQPTQAPGTGVTLRSFTPLGCFSNPGDMWDMGPYTFQTNGWCQPLCVRQGATYFALVNGTNCFCGNSGPDSGNKVSSSECDTTCNGYDSQFCGGTNRWAVYQDGYRNGDSTGTIAITTPTQTWFRAEATASTTLGTSVTNAQQKSTVVVTQAAQSDAATSSGPNTTAIAVGVAVGVVVLAAITGGSIIFIRRRKSKELEDERRRHDTVMNIVNKGEKPRSWGSDERLEPSVMFQRRQSDGSIMDNQDYSRRILKVTNPDDR